MARSARGPATALAAAALLSLAALAACGGGGGGGSTDTPSGGASSPAGPATSSTCATGGDGVSVGPVAYSGSFPNANGEEDTTLTVAGRAREVFLYLPSSRGTRPPLIIALHETGSPDWDSRFDMARLFEPLADAQGVVVAAPESRLQSSGDWDQHSGGEKFWETIPPDDPSRGCDPNRNPDLLLLRAIIQEAKARYNVDPRRIYLAGFSNGGFFSLHAAVAMRDQVAAFAEMSSGLVRCENTNSCGFAGSATSCAALRAEAGYCACTGTEKPIVLPTAGRMPPGFLTHGNQDYTVSVAYTCELAARMDALGHTNVVTIRSGDDHVPIELGSPGDFSPLWSFFAAHPLP